MRDVWSTPREQRCWVHKIANVLDKRSRPSAPAVASTDTRSYRSSALAFASKMAYASTATTQLRRAPDRSRRRAEPQRRSRRKGRERSPT